MGLPGEDRHPGDTPRGIATDPSWRSHCDPIRPAAATTSDVASPPRKLMASSTEGLMTCPLVDINHPQLAYWQKESAIATARTSRSTPIFSGDRGEAMTSDVYLEGMRTRARLLLTFDWRVLEPRIGSFSRLGKKHKNCTPDFFLHTYSGNPYFYQMHGERHRSPFILSHLLAMKSRSMRDLKYVYTVVVAS